jgi:hypothetical protein
MITLKQAQKVRHGYTLTQEDVDALNAQGGDVMKYAASWAWQYHHDSITEGKKADQFYRNAY